MEREELLMQIVEKQKEYISYLSKAIDSESILCAITLGVRSNYESELASLTSRLEKTEKPNKPVEVSEELKMETKCPKCQEDIKIKFTNQTPQVSQKTESADLFQKALTFLDSKNIPSLTDKGYIARWMADFAQSHQVEMPGDGQIQSFVNKIGTEYRKVDGMSFPELCNYVKEWFKSQIK